MAKVKSPAIGTVPCPWASCKETAEVRKFATTASMPGRARFGGKLYADCPRHGRFGSTGSADFQDYILEHATLYGPEGASPAPVAAPEPEEPAPVAAPKAAPVAPEPERAKIPPTMEPKGLVGYRPPGSGLLID